MTTEITMETQANTASRKVRLGKRVIGFICYFPAIASIGRPAGWTFIPNRDDIAAKTPKPALVFDDPKAVLRHINATLAA